MAAPEHAWAGPVPGIWWHEEAASQSHLYTYSFDADTEFLAQARRHARGEPGPAPRLAVRLRCITKADLAAHMAAQPGANPTPAQITADMCALPNRWPPRGAITGIDVNDWRAGGKRWAPRSGALDDGQPDLDLTPYIRLGTNTVKIVQLGDMSAHLLLLPLTRPDAP
jgi:hypothetical protein